MLPTAQQLLEVARARAAALVRRDLAAIESLLAPGFVYTNASGEVFDKGSYIQRYVADPSVVWISQEIVASQVIELGDSAILIARIHDVAHFGEYALDSELRTTQVYRRTDQGWTYVAGHTSSIAP